MAMRDYEELVNSLKNCVYIPCSEKQKEKCLAGKETDCKRELMAIAANAIKELVSNADKFKWIKIESRPMAEEERKEWSERIGYDIEYEDAIIYTSELPDDGQEVIVCNKWGRVWIDTFSNDPDYGVGFEENGDMDGIVAWMSLPEPPKEDANA
jgi:hypothetical protein